jgi:glyoxylase-like metal-dependent hydrolase (beta-lactamase superfamily II)
MEHLETDKNRLEEHPDLVLYLMNTKEGDTFTLDEDNITLKPIETPGHWDDHLCFMLEDPGQETILFTGDHIIGAASVSIRSIHTL